MGMQIEVSYGEVLDKITILEIKAARIDDKDKRANVLKELASLCDAWSRSDVDERLIRAQRDELKRVNEMLWDIEDRIRLKEASAAFDGEFIELARQVYLTNDDRSRIKQSVNDTLGSSIREEKSYKPYRR